jgi:pseudomonalisin/xanthomonalisin
MRRNALLALACALGLAALPVAAQAALAPSDDLGPRPPGAVTSIVVVLPHRNQAQLDELLRAIELGRAKPISHAQFVAQFAPAPESVGRVARFLNSRGFGIQRTAENLIFATAPTAVVQRTFDTVIHNVRTFGRAEAYAAVAPARLPSEIAADVITVQLDNTPMRRVK